MIHNCKNVIINLPFHFILKTTDTEKVELMLLQSGIRNTITKQKQQEIPFFKREGIPSKVCMI